MAVCWDRTVSSSFYAYVALLLMLFFLLGVSFPFGVFGRVCNSILSVHDHCTVITGDN